MKSSSPLVKRTFRKAFTRLENALITGLLVAVAVAAWYFWGLNRTADQSNREISDISRLSTCLNGAFNGEYADVSNARATEMGCGRDTSAWGDSVTLSQGEDHEQWQMSYARVPKPICKRILPPLTAAYEKVIVTRNGKTMDFNRDNSLNPGTQPDNTPQRLREACQDGDVEMVIRGR